MNRRSRPWIGMLFLAGSLAGCDYSADTSLSDPAGGSYSPGMSPVPTSPTPAARGTVAGGGPSGPAGGEKNKEILKNVLQLIRTASEKPGGRNFEVATLNLNQYFSNPSPADYALEPEARAYLIERLPGPVVRGLEAPEFAMIDARHLEDCMIYYRIANRVAGTGEDLDRVCRVFDWMVRQVQLVPLGRLGAPPLGQVQARPYDVLMRGMATEEGLWGERSWVFLALCRQLGIDAGLLTYTTRPPLVRADRTFPVDVFPLEEVVSAPVPSVVRRLAAERAQQNRRLVPWVCAALIDGKAYLFDTRIGRPLSGPDGRGVATLNDALDDPRVLEQLDLPGESLYGTTRAALLGSSSKIGVLLDSSPGYLAPRMRLLQRELRGEDRTFLYRDPADQARKFAEALGPHFGGADLWPMPMYVFNQLFSNGDFVKATQQALVLFDSRYPLIYARVHQLRGDLPEAIEEYVGFRFAEAPLEMDKKTPIPPDVQRGLDVHATYFLGLANLEQNRPDRAEFFFKATLGLLPEPGPGSYYYHMLRWGAETNLARLAESRGDSALAIAYYVRPNPTPQYHGNLLSARALVWRDPTAPVPPPPPDDDAGAVGR